MNFGLIGLYLKTPQKEDSEGGDEGGRRSKQGDLGKLSDACLLYDHIIRLVSEARNMVTTATCVQKFSSRIRSF